MNSKFQAINSTVFIYMLIRMVEEADFILMNDFNAWHILTYFLIYTSEQHMYAWSEDFYTSSIQDVSLQLSKFPIFDSICMNNSYEWTDCKIHTWWINLS